MSFIFYKIFFILSSVKFKKKQIPPLHFFSPNFIPVDQIKGIKTKKVEIQPERFQPFSFGLAILLNVYQTL